MAPRVDRVPNDTSPECRPNDLSHAEALAEQPSPVIEAEPSPHEFDMADACDELFLEDKEERWSVQHLRDYHARTKRLPIYFYGRQLPLSFLSQFKVHIMARWSIGSFLVRGTFSTSPPPEKPPFKSAFHISPTRLFVTQQKNSDWLGLPPPEVDDRLWLQASVKLCMQTLMPLAHSQSLDGGMQIFASLQRQLRNDIGLTIKSQDLLRGSPHFQITPLDSMIEASKGKKAYTTMDHFRETLARNERRAEIVDPAHNTHRNDEQTILPPLNSPALSPATGEPPELETKVVDLTCVCPALEPAATTNLPGAEGDAGVPDTAMDGAGEKHPNDENPAASPSISHAAAPTSAYPSKAEIEVKAEVKVEKMVDVHATPEPAATTDLPGPEDDAYAPEIRMNWNDMTALTSERTAPTPSNSTTSPSASAEQSGAEAKTEEYGQLYASCFDDDYPQPRDEEERDLGFQAALSGWRTKRKHDDNDENEYRVYKMPSWFRRGVSKNAVSTAWHVL